MSRSPWPFVLCLLGLAVCAAVLILRIPVLLDEGGDSSIAWAGILAALVVAFGVGARRWRPARA